MIRRQLGAEGPLITTVGLGCFAIGGFMWGEQDDEDSVRAIHAALDAGVDWLDTAPLYGEGRAEVVVRRALAELPASRRPLIATKFGHRVVEGERVRYGRPEQVVADCAASCERLGVETIDLFQLHWPTPDPIPETAAACAQLVAEGRVRFVGVSNFSLGECQEWRRHGPLACVQNFYSLFRREAEEEVLPWCIRHDVGFLAYSPMHRGLLFGGWGPDKTFPPGDHRAQRPDFVAPRLPVFLAAVDRLQAIALGHDLSLPQLAIGALVSREGMTAAIVGARNQAQGAALANLGTPLKRAVLDEVTTVLADCDQALAALA